jgi:hypothetical protein
MACGARGSQVLRQGKQDGAGGISTNNTDAFGEAVTVDIGLSRRKRYGIDVWAIRMGQKQEKM